MSCSNVGYIEVVSNVIRCVVNGWVRYGYRETVVKWYAKTSRSSSYRCVWCISGNIGWG